MEEVAGDNPEEVTYQIYLAQCYYETGRMEECRRVVRGVLDQGGDRPAARVLEGDLLLAEGRMEEGLASLLAVEQSDKPAQGIRYFVGRVYLNMKRWEDAERAFRVLLTWDADSPQAWSGLAEALLAQDKFEEAAEAAADALALRFDMPEAHMTLGTALIKLDRYDRATQAFEACLALRPGMPAASQWLAQLQETRACAGVG